MRTSFLILVPLLVHFCGVAGEGPNSIDPPTSDTTTAAYNESLDVPAGTDDSNANPNQQMVNASGSVRIGSMNDVVAQVSDLHGFLATVQTSSTSSNQYACMGTLIHADALITSAHCMDHFVVGSTVQFIGGDEDSIVWHVSHIVGPTRSKNNNSHDMLIVFLTAESFAPFAIWKHTAIDPFPELKHGTSFAYSSGRIVTKMTLDIIASETCFSTLSNMSRAREQDIDLVCATPTIVFSGSTSSTTTTTTTVAVGAPLLSENDNSVLGIVVRGSCECDTGFTNGQTPMLRLTRILDYMNDIEQALCTSSKFPPDGCLFPPLSSPMGVTTKRLLIASDASKRDDRFLSRLLQWLRKALFGTNAPKDPPPVSPPTRAPVKLPTRAPSPVPSAVPSFEPTSFTIPPTPAPVPPPKAPIPPPKAPIPPPLPVPPKAPVIVPKAPAIVPKAPAIAPKAPAIIPAAVPAGTRLACFPPSPKCPGERNLMQKFCMTQCVAEENVRRKRKAGWRCGDCS